jgi:hypothetical protein
MGFYSRTYLLAKRVNTNKQKLGGKFDKNAKFNAELESIEKVQKKVHSKKL